MVSGLRYRCSTIPAGSFLRGRYGSESIRERPCLLCPENRPAEQTHFEFDGRKRKALRVTLNPYPASSHLVVSSFDHASVDPAPFP